MFTEQWGLLGRDLAYIWSLFSQALGIQVSQPYTEGSDFGIKLRGKGLKESWSVYLGATKAEF